ncbi:unnamed protein product [Prunus armeniaca]
MSWSENGLRHSNTLWRTHKDIDGYKGQFQKSQDLCKAQCMRFGRGRNINKLLRYKNLLVQSAKPTPKPESPVDILDTITNREIVVLDMFPARENNTFMAARCDKED